MEWLLTKMTNVSAEANAMTHNVIILVLLFMSVSVTIFIVLGHLSTATDNKTILVY